MRHVYWYTAELQKDSGIRQRTGTVRADNPSLALVSLEEMAKNSWKRQLIKAEICSMGPDEVLEMLLAAEWNADGTKQSQRVYEKKSTALIVANSGFVKNNKAPTSYPVFFPAQVGIVFNAEVFATYNPR